MKNGGVFALAVGITNMDDWSTAPFRVTQGGTLYAEGAEIKGKITATSGKIGGIYISNGRLYLGDGAIYNSATGDAGLRLSSNGDLKVNDIVVDTITINIKNQSSGVYGIWLEAQESTIYLKANGNSGEKTLAS